MREYLRLTKREFLKHAEEVAEIVGAKVKKQRVRHQPTYAEQQHLTMFVKVAWPNIERNEDVLLLIQDAVSTLKPIEQKVLTRMWNLDDGKEGREFETFTDLARHLGVTSTTVANHYHRAVRKLNHWTRLGRVRNHYHLEFVKKEPYQW